MKLRVERYLSTPQATLGKLFIDEKFECFTLEDEFRAVKVMEETRIPQGTYEVKFHPASRMNAQYSKIFPEMHKGMLLLQNVPGFQGILIHIGNTEKDTAGCLLVGQERDEKLMTISRSTAAYRSMYPKVAAEIAAGRKVTIIYEDKDNRA